ncbi:redoxin domain-containing protein [Bacteroides sp. 519]|uniref:TlpA family protein disulfide reductase n=1 Tax=Bacteroides sp. 519 TaxID=2302937 RepID=UPI0013D83AA4|nr:redoxin domain-containing protein [Bacteroides sp. 519]NDV59658.1 TlpA family protein disulfide reductase [Bacteroides sp. 519]
MKNVTIWGIVLFTLMSFTGCVSGDSDLCGKNEQGGGANIQEGDALPTFSVKLNDQSIITNNSLDGKVSVILLFTVVCPDCQKQIPITERIYDDYKDNDDVVVFGISRAEGESTVGKFWNEHQYAMPYSAQDKWDIYNLFAKSIVPRIYVSSKDRIVRRVYTDKPLANYDELKVLIEELLNE